MSTRNQSDFVQNGESGTPDISPRPSSSVHTHEISEHRPDPPARDEFYSHPTESASDGSYFRFRHGGWAHLRTTVYDAMEEAGIKAGTLSRYCHCGDHTRLYRHSVSGELCLMGNFCRSRNCIPCANAKSKVVASNLANFIRSRRVRMLTLTIKHNGDEPLSFLMDRCWQSFKLLRRRPQWGMNVTGFAAFMETKWSARDSGWHVHLHCLTEGRWWDQKEISQLWHACTGDSFIVDIQSKGSTERMAFYASKYVTKPINPADCTARHRLVEAIRSTHGRHLYLIGGSWKGALNLLDKPPVSAEWDDIGSADALWASAGGGEPSALQIVRHLIEHALPITGTEHPQPPPGGVDRE